ncbi:MAG: NUDIX domain-containing protein [Patescibacteria group bacterium]
MGLWRWINGTCEDFESAVRREVKEEYLVDPDEVHHVIAENVLRDNNGTPTHWVAVLHVVKVDPLKVGIGEPDKIDELGWFHPDDFPEPLHSMMKPHFEKVRHLL